MRYLVFISGHIRAVIHIKYYIRTARLIQYPKQVSVAYIACGNSIIMVSDIVNQVGQYFWFIGFINQAHEYGYRVSRLATGAILVGLLIKKSIVVNLFNL